MSSDLVVHPPARRTDVHRGADLQFVRDHPSEPGTGISVAEYIGPPQGSVHLGASVVEHSPGAQVQGHLHPFEESFFVLDGEVLLNRDGRGYRLVAGDFGFVGIAQGHAWANVSDAPARVLRVQSPQARPMADLAPFGVYGAPEIAVPTAGDPVDELDPRQRGVGHFSDADVPPPGPILMPGFHGSNIRNVSIRMMVDELLGARHHTLFVVEFAPDGDNGLSAKEHFHPFEEIYYFVRGEASGSFDGATMDIAAGDLVFAGVGASHGFRAIGDRPVRWIEAQAPLPPAEDGFFFHADWAKLEPLG
jgi:quercetin dioxygenase-like cupin family protein